MKKKRHELILKLIEEHEITTQEELLLLLQKNGPRAVSLWNRFTTRSMMAVNVK